MKNISVLTLSLLIATSVWSTANAGLLNGGVKGVGKGAKTVAGCCGKGVKGVGKGARTTVGCVGKGAKSTAGGIGKAAKTTL